MASNRRAVVWRHHASRRSYTRRPEVRVGGGRGADAGVGVGVGVGVGAGVGVGVLVVRVWVLLVLVLAPVALRPSVVVTVAEAALSVV